MTQPTYSTPLSPNWQTGASFMPDGKVVGHGGGGMPRRADGVGAASPGLVAVIFLPIGESFSGAAGWMKRHREYRTD
jgi:hypothetical protein